MTVEKNNETGDKPIKSIVKTITWRVIASATTFALALLFFRSDDNAIQKATGVAIAESVIKMVLYFFHERAWAKVRWDRIRVVLRKRSRKSRKIFIKPILKRA
jgi:uncharacterized membrane protein